MSGSDMDSLESKGWCVVDETTDVGVTMEGDDTESHTTEGLSEENRKPTRKDPAIEAKDRMIAKMKEKGQREKESFTKTKRHQEQEIETLKGFENGQPRLLEKIESLEGLHQTLKEQLRDLENRLEESESSRKNLENACHKAENNYRSLLETNVTLKEANRSLEEEKNTLLSGEKKASEEIELQKQEIETLKGFENDQPRLLGKIESLEGLHQTQNEKIRDLKNRLEESESTQKNLAATLHKAENNNRSLMEKNVTLKEANRSLEEEKNTLLLRLSKMAGAKLTYDNPNIADLSDKKRPTKLAEEFAELYDNEWTDAFEHVNSDNENEKTASLLNLLQRANVICREVSFEHIERIKRSLCTLTVCTNSPIKRPSPAQENDNIKRLRLSDQEEHNGHSTVSEVSFDYSSLQSDQKKTVMELKKFIEFGLVNDLVKMVTDKIIDEFSIDRDTQGPLLTYISICVQICWSMCQVEPPVFIDFSKEPGDMCFDTAIYKPYTKSGKFVDFVVWPAVHLHENGPLLCKGVAQGRN